jgi:small subunit ribosomal protein S2
MPEIKFEDLLGTGAHFGHVTRKWNPNFKPYILLEKNGVHIINLESTIEGFNKASAFVKDIISKNGEILFVGTKKQAQDIVQQEADKCSMFYIVERWLGGTLTNFSTIKKSIKRLKMLEKEGSNLYENLTKKETQMLNRERVKLADQHRGIKDMRRLPDAVIVVDGQYEATAILEAKRLSIPVIAIVDSNTDPSKVDYPIPANDDSIRTIQLIIAALADAVNEARGISVEKNEKKSDDKVDTGASEQPVPENELKAESVPEEVAVEEVVEVTAKNTEEISAPAETLEVQDREDVSKDKTPDVE